MGASEVSSFSSFTDLAEPKLPWRHLLPSGLSAVFKCPWSKGEKERGTVCNSSWLLRDGPSCAPHPWACPPCAHQPFHKAGSQTRQQEGRKRTRGTGKAGTGATPRAAPRFDTGPATALKVPLHIHALPALLPSAASANELLIISLSQQQSHVGVSLVQERFIQSWSEQPVPH